MSEFRKRKICNVIRKKSWSSDEETGSDIITTTRLEDIKAVQRLRCRQHGISAASLALGKRVDMTEEEITDTDPFKMKTGGFVDMKALKSKPLTGEVAEVIGTSFASETNRRDEDAEMLKYVDVEVARRKGHKQDEVTSKPSAKNQEDLLYQLPAHLNVSTSAKKTEDMLSNAMLSGIPEIDLGIEAKIANIEATEDAKQQLLWERMNKKEEVSDFVPSNMAVNYMQHNRFRIDDRAPQNISKTDAPKPAPLRVGDVEKSLNAGPMGRRRPARDEATDDFHYERFKKQMRRF